MRRVRHLLLPLLLSSLGCVFHTRTTDLEAGPGKGHVGTFSVDGKQNLVSKCWSGDRSYFRGVDLVAESEGATLRLLIDPMEGPRLRLIRSVGGSPESVVFAGADCQDLQVEVVPTGWRVNRVLDFKGELQAECRSASGVVLQARLSFSHCH